MLTHEKAKSLFDGCRNKSRGHKIAHKTYIQMRRMSCVIRLHETDIVLIRPDNTYRINSGGFRTTTTRRRMNHVLPCVINQKNSLWSIGDSFFEDGMLVGHDGAIIGESTPLSEAVEIKRKVDRYCNKFISLVLEMCVTEPITELQTYKKYRLPKHYNKNHLDDLWYNEIQYIVNYAKTSMQNISVFYTRMMKWAYLAMLERGYNDIQWCWDYRRDSCKQKNCYVVRHDLLAFMSRRKSNITQMILAENKSDDKFPSLGQAETFLSNKLVLVS